jgi:hypothetical protein
MDLKWRKLSLRGKRDECRMKIVLRFLETSKVEERSCSQSLREMIIWDLVRLSLVSTCRVRHADGPRRE